MVVKTTSYIEKNHGLRIGHALLDIIVTIIIITIGTLEAGRLKHD